MKNITYNIDYTLPKSQRTVDITVKKIKQTSKCKISISIQLKILVTIPYKLSKEKVINYIAKNSEWLEDAYFDMEKKAAQKYNKDIFKNEPIMFLGAKTKITVVQSQTNFVERKDDEIIIYTRKTDDNNYISKIFTNYCKEILFNIISHYVNYYLEIIPDIDITPEIKIHKMRTMWGNCYYNKNLMCFNFDLIFTPISAIEYIVLHELYHFKHHNHNKDFFEDIEKLMPDYKSRDAKLKKY